MVKLKNNLKNVNYLCGFSFHKDICDYIYYADSPKKNYTFIDVFTKLKILIFSGNLDSGINIYSNEEPSVLYTSFKIMKPRTNRVGKIPYYPRYRALNPYQRYEYILFLINPYTKKTKQGYLYLLLYCLERRLSEGNEAVIPVMTKLADFHGGSFKGSVYNTLRKYNLWKSGSLYPQNTKVYNNYTLYCVCYDELTH